MGMKTFVVRYRARPERADENQRLVEAVFTALREVRPPGISYRVLRLPDDTFMHVVREETEGAAAAALGTLPAFRAFSSSVRERAFEAPQRTDVVLVGAYDVD